MAHFPDFTDTELWVIRSTLNKRCGKGVEVRLADAGVRLEEGDPLAECPLVFWRERGAEFAICRTDQRRYRAEFSVRPLSSSGPAAESSTKSANAPPLCRRSRPTTSAHAPAFPPPAGRKGIRHA